MTRDKATRAIHGRPENLQHLFHRPFQSNVNGVSDEGMSDTEFFDLIYHRDRFKIAVIKSVPGIDLQSEFAGILRGFLQSCEF